MAPTLGESVILVTGPLFIGIILNWGLFGTLCMQLYTYYCNYPKDTAKIKGVVWTVFVLDVLQTIFATHCIWGMLVLGWGDLNVLVHPPWSGTTFPIMSGLISLLVQLFFAWRIWTLRKGFAMRASAVFIVLVALMQSISAIVAAIRSGISNDLSTLHSLFIGFTIWLAGSLAADILIAVCMVIILNQSRAKSKFKRTDTIVSRLIAQSIETGAITAFAAGLELVLFLVYQNNTLHDIPAMTLGKLYSNVLLANLNARRSMNSSSDHSASTGPTSIHLSRFQDTDARHLRSELNMTKGEVDHAPLGMGVHVSTHTKSAMV